MHCNPGAAWTAAASKVFAAAGVSAARACVMSPPAWEHNTKPPMIANPTLEFRSNLRLFII